MVNGRMTSLDCSRCSLKNCGNEMSAQYVVKFTQTILIQIRRSRMLEGRDDMQIPK
jgi:hypothetical protein